MDFRCPVQWAKKKLSIFFSFNFLYHVKTHASSGKAMADVIMSHSGKVHKDQSDAPGRVFLVMFWSSSFSYFSTLRLRKRYNLVIVM